MSMIAAADMADHEDGGHIPGRSRESPHCLQTRRTALYAIRAVCGVYAHGTRLFLNALVNAIDAIWTSVALPLPELAAF